MTLSAVLRSVLRHRRAGFCSHAARVRREGARGFTLTELMVAMSGGLMISISVFLLARQASRFYQSQAHTAEASITGMIGFERLRADIARAGFMATPNIRQDPIVCAGPTVNLGTAWPTYLNHLQSIWIVPAPQVDSYPTGFSASIAAAGLSPQAIVLAGNYSSPDQYEVRDIEMGAGATNTKVYLALQSVAMRRVGTVANDVVSVSNAQIQAIFKPDTAVRIVDPSGRQLYGRVVNAFGGDSPYVELSNSPQLQTRDTGPGCGISGTGTGALINPVNIVRYDLRSLATNDNYKALYADPSDADTRVDLIREELSVDGTPIDSTLELIAEYTVNLDFTLTAAIPGTGRLEEVGITGWADNTSTSSPITGPQMLRAVGVTLSVRSRDADRATSSPIDSGPLLRFGIGPNGKAPYARVRTVSAQVALNNQLGLTW
ncbi:MAG TPA: prepilin-type N-terminal cleavage/methylation domain-containing protein [Polyangiaceae bacterium]|nr:prepilin-type N-terminal cleavage/methylation domain-containing protein [Polyangiaceae bacterium]